MVRRIARWGAGRRRRALVSLPLGVLLLVALGGCWPAPGYGPDRTAHNPVEAAISPETVGSLQELWSTGLNTAVVNAPVVVGDAVYASDALTVHRFDAATGARRWEVPIDQPPPGVRYHMSAPFVVGDRVLVGWGGPEGAGLDGGRWVTQWLDPDSGALLGEVPPGGQVEGVRDGRVLSTREVFVSSASEPQLALVVSDGEGEGESWMGLLGPREVTLGRDHVYAAGPSPTAPSGEVSAFPVDGARTDCGPTPDLPFVCPTWTTPIEGASSEPVLGDGGATVFVTTDALPAGRAMLHALDARTGALRWSVDLDANAASTPALAEGRLYVPTQRGLVVVSASGCGAATCVPLWSASTGGWMSQQPAVAGGVVFTTSFDSLNGYVHAFDAAGCGSPTCQPLWSTWVDGEITGAPAVSGGRLFVGTGHQELIAFG